MIVPLGKQNETSLVGLTESNSWRSSKRRTFARTPVLRNWLLVCLRSAVSDNQKIRINQLVCNDKVHDMHVIVVLIRAP